MSEPADVSALPLTGVLLMPLEIAAPYTVNSSAALWRVHADNPAYCSQATVFMDLPPAVVGWRKCERLLQIKATYLLLARAPQIRITEFGQI